MPTLEVVDDPDPSLREVIAAGIVAFNASQAGPNYPAPLATALRDEQGQVVGGLWGKTSYQWLFVELLFVPEMYRGRDLGTRLMQLAEQRASERGCIGAWLDTYGFQARAFYERLGYEVFGEIADCPPGSSRFFLRKRFV